MNTVRNKKRSFFIILVIFIGVFVSFTSTPSVSKVEAADGYPYANDQTGNNDPWGFVKRQCTSYAAWRLNQNGISFTWQYGGQTWGHAKTWGNAAKQAGLSVDMNPRVGDIGWKVANKGGAGDFGHVVYISAVNGNTVTCEQYNWNPAKRAYIETKEDKSKFSGFIHFSNPQPVHQHSYPITSSYVEKAPTFTSEGVLRFKCSCGDTNYSRTIPALGDGEFKAGKYMLQSCLDANKYVSIAPNEVKKEGNICLYSKGFANQAFAISKNDDSTYTIGYNDLVVDVSAGSAGGNIQLWTSNGTNAQRWYIVPAGNGYYRLVNKAKYFTMDVNAASTADGTNIGSHYFNGTNAQKFKLILLSCNEHDWKYEFRKTSEVDEDGTEYFLVDKTCKDCGETELLKIPYAEVTTLPIPIPDFVKRDDKNNDSNDGLKKEDTKNDSNNNDKSKTGEMFSNEWVDGKWYNEDGTQTYTGTLTWKSNATGWWIEDTDGWYPTDQWQKIDGIWYFFKPDGYMASSEYYNGYWFNSDGAWDSQYLLSWKSNSTGWWVEDISGWWPQSSWLKIDGYWYYFDASGYMVTNQYVDGYWIGSDGICY